MNRRFALAICFLMLLFSLIWLRFKLDKAKAPAGLVRNIDTGLSYATIQEAINANETLDGHRLSIDFSIFWEHVVINKSLSLYGGITLDVPDFPYIYMPTINGNGSGAVVTIEAADVTMISIRIMNGTNGIVQEADNALLWGLKIQNNTERGLCVNNSNDCTIEYCNFTTNRHGVWLNASNSNTINNNYAANNVFEESGTGIYLGHSSNNTISENDVKGNYEGIHFLSSTNNTISANKIMANKHHGIKFELCSHNDVSENTVSSNIGDGVFLYNSSSNTFYKNNIKNNYYGISPTYYSSSNNFFLNNITNSYYSGILLSDHSSNNSIYANNMEENMEGIFLLLSSSNNIFKNNLTRNKCGIHVEASLDNIIYHNRFINNTQQVYMALPGFASIWDDGYPSGGNYWSDYVERYPNATEIDDSNIWNTPYVIDANNIDYYPLVPEFQSSLAILLLITATTLVLSIRKKKQLS